MTFFACLWVGLFPLLHGGTYAEITRDKWIIMVTLWSATICCFPADLIARRKQSRLPLSAFLRETIWTKPQRLPLTLGCLFIIWMIISCLSSPYGPDTWLLGASSRREGLLTQLCYLSLFICFTCSRVRIKPVILSSAAGVIVFFLVVVMQRSGGNPMGLYPQGTDFALHPEFQGTIGNIDMDTGYLCMITGILLHSIASQVGSIRDNKERLSRKSFLFLFITAAGLLCSLWLVITMGVFFGLLTILLLFLVTLLNLLPRKLRIPVILVLLVFIMLLVWFRPGTDGALWEAHEIIHGRGQLSFGHNRIAVWYYSLKLAKEQLFLGSGSDTFVYRFNDFLKQNGYTIPQEQGGISLPSYFDNPHNEYIAHLINHGLPAMLLLILCVILSVFWKRDGLIPVLTAPGAGVLCYGIQAVFSFSVCVVAPVFWVIMAISFQNCE